MKMFVFFFQPQGGGGVTGIVPALYTDVSKC